MRTMTSTQARQNFSYLISSIGREPVSIEKQRKSVAMIISSSRYEELKRLEDILYAKAAKLAIEEGLAPQNEVNDLLDSI